jgi:hypothetical protein
LAWINSASDVAVNTTLAITTTATLDAAASICHTCIYYIPEDRTAECDVIDDIRDQFWASSCHTWLHWILFYLLLLCALKHI